MKYRSLAAVAAAVLAVVGLTGCDSKVGAAATVGAHVIPESRVNQYLTDQAKPFDNGQGGQIVPRSYVLRDLILGQLLPQALAKKGGVPSSSTLAALERQLTQGATTAQKQAQYTHYGFRRSFAEVDIRIELLETLLARRTNSQNISELAKVVNALHVPVSVSRRYGAWDPSTLTVATSDGAGLPSMVTLQPSAVAQP